MTPFDPGRPRSAATRWYLSHTPKDQIARAVDASRSLPIKQRRLQSLANTLARKRGRPISLPVLSIQKD